MKKYTSKTKQILSLVVLVYLATLTTYAQNPWKEKAKYLPQSPYLANNEDDFGSSVSSNAEYLVIGSSYYMQKGSVYVVSNDGQYDTLAILTASDGSYGDRFGHSVSISDSVIVVGAYNFEQSKGAAYIFVKPANGWVDMTETAKLSASDGALGDEFGCSVSISDSVVVVGASKNFVDGVKSGAAYVYIKPENGWQNMIETAKLNSSVKAYNDAFGCAVDICKNVIAIGAFGDDEKADLAGSVYVFVKPESGWISATETAKLTVSDGAQNDVFGTSVSIYDSIIVAGARNVDYIGAAYIFVKPATGWSNSTEIAKLTPSDGSHSNQFGYAVDIYDSIVVVGSIYYSNGIPQQGSAYVYVKPDEGWSDMTETGRLNASDIVDNGTLGRSVSIFENVIAVGATEDDGNGYRSGSLYVFEKPVTGWTNMFETVKILPVGYLTNFSDQFGISVDVDDDFAIVGSPVYKTRQGFVYLFSTHAPYDTLATLMASDAEEYQNFGHEVYVDENKAIVLAKNAAYLFKKPESGWKNMPETAKLTCSKTVRSIGGSLCVNDSVIVIGATGNGVGGEAYVFVMPEGGWTDMTETAILSASDAEYGNWFGSSVAISDTVIVVGSDWVDNESNNEGTVYVFVKPEEGWINATETAKLSASDGGDNYHLGISVSISDSIIVAGSYGYNSSKGAVYLYAMPHSGWQNMTETAKLTASDADNGDYLGYSVSMYKNTIATGAYRTDQEGAYTGSAYIFQKTGNSWTNMTETYKIEGSEAVFNNDFGKYLSLHKSNLIVGAYSDRDNGRTSGIAYLFKNIYETYATVQVEACGVFESPSKNYYWNSSGTYVDTIPNAIGHDSIITIHLVIHPMYTMNKDTTICSGDSIFIEGAYQTTEGMYTDKLSTIEGCDSVIMTNLKVENCSIGLQIIEQKNFTVFPNPTSGQIEIALDQIYNKVTVLVYNQLGQKTLSKDFYSKDLLNLDLSGEKGLYYIEIISNHQMVGKVKVLKM